MSLEPCTICGKTKYKESRPCPKLEGKMICGTDHCSACEYFRKPEDAGTLWCTYKNKTESYETTIYNLRKRIAATSQAAKSAYAHDWPRLGRQKEDELVRLQAELRRLEREAANE